MIYYRLQSVPMQWMFIQPDTRIRLLATENRTFTNYERAYDCGLKTCTTEDSTLNWRVNMVQSNTILDAPCTIKNTIIEECMCYR